MPEKETHVKPKKAGKWKPGMACVPGNMQERNGKVYICNNKGKWVLKVKEVSIQGGIKRLFPGLTKK